MTHKPAELDKGAGHTPGPWAVSADGTRVYSKTRTEWIVADCAAFMSEAASVEANTAFIVRACNSHYELLEALEEARELICKTWCDESDTDCPHCHECQDAQAAIAKARTP